MLVRQGGFTSLVTRFGVPAVLALGFPLSPPVVPVFEHVKTLGIQGPVAALARAPLLPGNLDEAVVQREVVADRVLPALLVVMVKRKAVHDELIDAAERGALLRGVLDGHSDERYVAVRWLLRRLLAR